MRRNLCPKRTNGLKIEWGVANKTSTSGTDRIITKSFNLVFTQPPCFTFAPYFPNNNGNHWFPDVTSLSASSFTVNSRQYIDDVPIRWIAIGY